MNNLLGQIVSFIPSCLYNNNKGYATDDIKPVRGTITEISKNGWFRVRWYAGDSVQHECFKEADIGKAVTLVGRSKVDKNHHRHFR